MTKTLLELEDGDCRFPDGRPEWRYDGLQAFCAKPRELGKPYCATCCAIAYVPTTALAVEPLVKRAA